ncbi:hypothetical protein [Leptolyngbya sp. FACHB-17]|uniref:hypothetical protein n=1 Tax=unclassified Leptolyngbya TaxID=2650499 RepID=UPI0016811B74|nr:hypothetical protein [Leptolyngbya sp. FACHB-17]MBD2079176.1 hypothetical protein [Leptolyngbya sp. FACHB-17]
MATEQQVRQYLAYWFQLGKRLMTHNGRQALKVSSVIAGDRYSDEFEACWNLVRAPESGDCYIEGTTQTIRELLSSDWEINSCARCAMPVPMRSLGMPPSECPCADLPFWPDSETPQPRSPVRTSDTLQRIRDRLSRSSH